MSAQRVAVTTGAPATAAAFAPTLPSHATGDRMVLVVTGKYNTTSIPTINQGWVLVQSGTGGTGTTGNDAGQTFWAVYAKDAASGAETAPTVTPGGTAPNSWEWACFTYSHGSTGWVDAITNGAGWVTAASDSTTASPLTGTAGAWTGVEPTSGDAILAVGVIPTDLGSALGATTLTCTGLSGGTKSTATSQYVENALGQDSALVWADWVDFTGTASAGLAMSFTVTGATNQSGSLVAIALRAEPPDPNAAVFVSSSRSGQSDSNTSSNSCPVPAGAAAGMTALLAIEVFLDSGSSPITPTWPAGFTQMVDRQAVPSNGVQLLVAKKTLSAADAGNYVTTFPSARWNMSMCVLIDKGVTVSTPDANSLKDGSGTAIAGLSVSTTRAPVLVHFQANSSSGSHTPPLLFTEQQEGDYLTVATRVPGAGGAYSTTGASQSVSTVWAAVLIAIEGGGGTPQGSGTGSVAVSGTATGRTTKRGTGTGSATVSGTATGRTTKRGSGTGAITVSGSAQGTTPVVGPRSGSGSGSVVVSGTASGSTTKRGSGTGAITVSGSAQGRRNQRGAGTGAITVSGAAAGSTTKRGAGTGAVTVSGSASGTAPGIGPRSGSGTGSLVVSGTASGVSIHGGSGSGSVALSGSASGERHQTGSGTGLVAVSGSAQGVAPLVGVKNGSGSGSVVVSGSASGSIDTSGSGSGAVVVEGGSSGTAAKSGSGVGQVLVAGFASAAVMGTPATHPGIMVERHDGRTHATRSEGTAQARTYAGRVKVIDHDGTADQ